MSLEQIVCVSLGSIFQVATFVLGLAVGISLSRKDSKNDNGNSRTKTAAYWHGDHVERRGTP
jgi:hypothetical protein